MQCGAAISITGREIVALAHTSQATAGEIVWAAALCSQPPPTCLIWKPTQSRQLGRPRGGSKDFLPFASLPHASFKTALIFSSASTCAAAAKTLGASSVASARPCRRPCIVRDSSTQHWFPHVQNVRPASLWNQTQLLEKGMSCRAPCSARLKRPTSATASSTRACNGAAALATVSPPRPLATTRARQRLEPQPILVGRKGAQQTPPANRDPHALQP